MLEHFVAAFALVLVFEGILPFLSPKTWRNSVTNLLKLDNSLIRIFGLISMLVGVIILSFFTDFR